MGRSMQDNHASTAQYDLAVSQLIFSGVRNISHCLCPQKLAQDLG